MRIVSGLLALVLLGFAAVQYNDPDGPLWALFYGIGAAWTAAAAFAPVALGRRPWTILLGLSAVAALAAVVWFWPTAPGWWRQEVWWEVEEAREGMGVMILALAMLAPVATALRAGALRRRIHS